jgi:membrane protein implicated in regulation of membrane protease activity
MKPESARALLWTTCILIVLAFIIMSPTGAFALFALAAVCAAVPSVFASKWSRVISLVLLIASIALAASAYPAFRREREAYMQRAKERVATPQDTTPTE